jgi:hypothetical protein
MESTQEQEEAMQVIYKLSKNETVVANEMVRLLKQMGWELGQEEKPEVELLSTCPGADDDETCFTGHDDLPDMAFYRQWSKNLEKKYDYTNGDGDEGAADLLAAHRVACSLV